ncbi:hypothetical protein DER29_0485 [Micromonospora sp. M71_S20]|uniref:hypothetical protein n=1 Tax=Micromonospora sp. M71_S20 TaxID=592872 RepID=UPI000EADD510|nr:hypothetical protein [Micromonospora sp. M71_S20]RLK22647.1 hypothetical protein DER29_0485 [Micromonospora sp. M71_S20]
MSIYTHGGDLAAYVIVAGEGNALTLGAGAALDAWNTRTGGEQLTDLTALDGAPLAAIVSSDGTDGFAPGQIAPYKAPLPAVWLGEAGNPAAPRVLSLTVDMPDLISQVGQAATDAQRAAEAAAASAAELAASSSVDGHEAAADPHPQYLTPERGDGRYLAAKPPPSAPLTEAREVFDFTSTPASSDADMRQVYVTHNGVRRLVAWLNERGYYRAEQVSGALYDAPLVSITAHNGTGRALQIQQRGADNVRRDVGGIDKDGRVVTTDQAWVAPAAVDPGATGKYVAKTGGSLDPLGVRFDSNDIVRMRGRLTYTASTVSGEVMFTLPAGYAPTRDRMLIAPVSNGAASTIEVMTTGAVIVRRPNTGAPSDISFDDLTYHR